MSDSTSASPYVPNVAQLVAIKGDAEKAKEYKDKLAKLCEPICELLTEAKRENIVLAHALQADATGRFFVAMLSAHKEL
jgi:hypothetical protein